MTPHCIGDVSNGGRRNTGKQGTYNNDASAKHSGRWTNEAVFLIGAARPQRWKIAKTVHQVARCRQLQSRRLGRKTWDGEDLHIVTELEVAVN